MVEGRAWDGEDKKSSQSLFLGLEASKSISSGSFRDPENGYSGL